jgi:periplasmic divalent cation tolerance protein
MPAPERRAYGIVMTSYSKAVVGRRIAETLLGENLAACVQILPIQSFYTWKGKTVKSRERLMLIKARRSDYGKIERLIQGIHDYEVPEIILVDIEKGSKAYLGWLSDSTR